VGLLGVIWIGGLVKGYLVKFQRRKKGKGGLGQVKLTNYQDWTRIWSIWPGGKKGNLEEAKVPGSLKGAKAEKGAMAF